MPVEHSLFREIESQLQDVKNSWRSNPLVIGGTSGSGGGSGTPPGGVVGQLPQIYVAGDTSESDFYGEGSPASLLDNLDRIRAWGMPSRNFWADTSGTNYLTISPGSWYYEDGIPPLIFTGQNSPSLTPPSSGGRYDRLTINTMGILAWSSTAEGNPPEYPTTLPRAASGQLPLWMVLSRSSGSIITRYDDSVNHYIFRDERPYLGSPTVFPSSGSAYTDYRWFVDGVLSPSTDINGVYYIPDDLMLYGSFGYLKTTPSSGSVVIDLQYSPDNGSSWASIYSSGKLTILSGDDFGMQSPDAITLNAGTLVRANLDDVGGGDAANLSVNLYGTIASASGGGTVMSVSVLSHDGIVSTVTNGTTTPSIDLSLGNILTAGTIEGSNLTGTNTGDQTITLSGDVTGTGTGDVPTTLSNTGIVPGQYTLANVTFGADGRAISASSGSGTAAIYPYPPFDVGDTASSGSSADASAGDHVHVGVTSITPDSDLPISGAVKLKSGTNITLTPVGKEITISSAGGSAHVIQGNGTPFAQRSNLNFTGASTVSDDGLTDTTTVGITGPHIIQSVGGSYSHRANLKFLGGVSVEDDSINGATTVTISSGSAYTDYRWFVDGVLAPSTDINGVYYIPDDLTLEGSVGYLKTTPSSGSTIIDLQYSPDSGISWVSIYSSTKLTILSGNNFGVQIPDAIVLSAGTIIRASIDDAGGGSAEGLSINLYGTIASASGGGTVSSVSVLSHNGIISKVTNGTTTPSIDLSLGDIVTPGTIEGANLTGTNTGDQTITLSGDVNGTGSDSITTSLSPTGVTAGSYTLPNLVLDVAGRVLSASSGSGVSPIYPYPPEDVSDAPVPGDSYELSAGNHIHRGLTGAYTPGNDFVYGVIALIAGDGQTITQSSGSFTFSNTSGSNPAALASVAESNAGVIDNKAVTPAGLPLRVENGALINNQPYYPGITRGSGAVDLQSGHYLSTADVAAGDHSFIGGGAYNSTGESADYSAVVAGNNNRAYGFNGVVGGGEGNSTYGKNGGILSGKDNRVDSANAGIPGGVRALARNSSQIVSANGCFSSNGDAQGTIQTILNGEIDFSSTTGWQNLYVDGLTDALNETLTVPTGSTWTVDILISAASEGLTGRANYGIVGAASCLSGIVTIDAQAVTNIFETTPGWDVRLSSSGSADNALLIQAWDGSDSETIRWSATVRTSELTYPQPPPPPVPNPPTDLSATVISGYIFTTWTDNSSDESGFKIERGTDGVNFAYLNTVVSNGYNDEDVTSGTYYYRVYAFNDYGNSGYSNTASVTL